MNELEQQVARMVCIGFDGTAMPDAVRDLMKRGVSAAILFSRNVQSAAQVAALTSELKAAAGRPFLIGIDQEGGRVVRLRDGFTPIPSMRNIGATGRRDLAVAVGCVLRRELRVVNIDMDFAPVLDVDTNPANPVIADRSLGRSPELVAELGAAIITALQTGDGQFPGVAACAKHFPGHGDTSQDSHLHLPRLPHAMERLMRVELVPFRAAIEVGVAAIMSAHVHFEAIDPHFPATMSRPALDGILRDRFGFEGVVVSDDMEMKAIAGHYGINEAVTRGTLAGVDLFLLCHDPQLQHGAIDALVHAVENGTIARARIEQAVQRLDRLYDLYVRPPVAGGHAGDLSILNSKEHRELIALPAPHR